MEVHVSGYFSNSRKEDRAVWALQVLVMTALLVQVSVLLAKVPVFFAQVSVLLAQVSVLAISPSSLALLMAISLSISSQFGDCSECLLVLAHGQRALFHPSLCSPPFL